MNYMFTVFCAFWLPSMMVLLGMVYILRKDWAWRFVEWALKSSRPRRSPAWDAYLTLAGILMVLSGLGIIIFLAFQLGG